MHEPEHHTAQRSPSTVEPPTPTSPAMRSAFFDPALDPAAVADSRLRLSTRILQLADGDPARATQIRGMLWAEYCDAGAPLGASEDAMYVWWDDELADAVA